jgi:hypothetical protein
MRTTTGTISLFEEPQYQRPERMRAYAPVYYSTPQWRTRANERKAIDRHRCQGCRKTAVKLQAHHLTREYLGYELPSDLISLCDSCHQRWEDLRLVA